MGIGLYKQSQESKCFTNGNWQDLMGATPKPPSFQPPKESSTLPLVEISWPVSQYELVVLLYIGLPVKFMYTTGIVIALQ